MDTFFLPWCEEAFLKKNYDEKAIMEAINNEIKRLGLLKVEASRLKSRNRMASVSTSDIRCVSKGCKYPGLNTKNKAAVGVCARCGAFEHYEC